MAESQCLYLPQRTEELTAEWLSAALSERQPGTRVQEVCVDSVISGTAGKVRLVLSYGRDSNPWALPLAMWIKGGFFRHDYSYDHAFVAEARFFSEWARELTINIPRAFWSGWEDGIQGLVLMEDLADREATFGNAAKGLITLDQQAQALELLAALHAKWWQSPRLKTLRNFSTAWEAADNIVMAMLRPEWFDACINARRCQAYVGPYRDRDRVIAGLRAQWRKGRDIPQAFVHGDAHLGNMFFEPDGKPGYLDWQAFQEGPYMHDVAYSIIGNVTVADRRHAEKDLLAGYLSSLERNGVEIPPTMDDAWQAYRRHAMHGFMWPFTPEEMQPLEIVTAEGDCFGAAVSDLDTFGALGV